MTIESPGQPSQKLDSVQALRAVAALMVLLYHLVNTGAFGWETADGNLPQPAALISAIGFAGVDLFFVISGVVMVVTCYNRFGRPGEVGPFLSRRMVRIYPLYWLATLGVLTISWLRPERTARDKFDSAALLKSLLLWPQDEFPIVAVGWTLSYEMFFYLTFSVLLLLPRRLLPGALFLWSAATMAMFMQHRDPAQKLTPDGHLALPLYASPLALEFIAGCFVGWFVKRGASALAGAATAIGLALLVAAGGYVGQNFPQEAQYGLLRAGVFGGSAALIAYGVIGLEVRRRLHAPRWLVFWGDASYSTYLTHMYVLWLIAAAWPAAVESRSSSGISGADAWLRTLAAIFACGAFAAVCHLTIERPIHRWLLRRLTPRAASDDNAAQTA